MGHIRKIAVDTNKKIQAEVELSEHSVSIQGEIKVRAEQGQKWRKWQERKRYLFIVGTVFALSGCGAIEQAPEGLEPYTKTEGNEKTQLKVLYSREDITWSLVMDDLCSKFEAENPDIDLELLDSGSGIYEETLKVKEALNEFPDLFEISNVKSYVDNDRLGEIPDSVSSLIEEPESLNQRIYTVPVYTTTYGIIYNHVLFKQYNLEAPKTYEQFLEVCAQLNWHKIAPLVCGGTKEDSVAYWLNYFYQKDVLLIDEEKDVQDIDGDIAEYPAAGKELERGVPDFTSEEYITMLQDYQQLITGKNVLKDSVYMNDSQIISRFLNAQVAMYYTKPSFIANIILADPDCISSMWNNVGKEIEDDKSTVRLAWFFPPTKLGTTIAATEVGAQFAISKECAGDPARYKAAERFFQFLFEDENYREILKSMYGFPTTKKRILYPAPSVQQHLIVDYRYARKEKSFLMANDISGGFQRELTETLSLLAGNAMTAEEAARYLDERWREIRDR